jgi:tetratricopeptide (TPR) repeat protein
VTATPRPGQAVGFDDDVEDLGDEALEDDTGEDQASSVGQNLEPSSQSMPLLQQAAPAEGAFVPYSDSDAQPTHLEVGSEQHDTPEWATEAQVETMDRNAQQLAELLEGQLARKPDRAREGRLHYELARVYESPLGRLDDASRHYEHAARLMPDHVPSLRGARRVLTALRRFKQALKLFDVELEATSDSGHKAVLLFQKGRMLAEQLNQKADARSAYEQAAELAPNRLDVLKALASAEEQGAAWRKLVGALERAANAATGFPAERAAYLGQMARVYAGELRDPKQAIELYKAALSVDPHAPAALHALKELLYQEHRWKELIDALELEAGLATTREAQAYAKLRAGQLWVERLGDLARGASTIEQASALAPGDVTILEELVRLYDLADQPKGLASAYERLAAQQRPPSVGVLHRLGQLYEEDLNLPDLAVERYAMALQVDPAFRPATLALARLWEQRGEWRALAEMLSKEADASDDAEHRAAIHERIAELCEVRLGSVDYAIEHHKKALELRTDHGPAFKALVRLYSQLHRFHELIELYRRGAETARYEDERITLLFSIGRLEEEALLQPEAAARTYEQIIELNPDSLEAIHALQRAAERGGEYRQLLRALEMEVGRSKDRQRQLALRHRAAMIVATELHDSSAAIESLQEILKDDPSYRPAIVSSAELLFKEGRWDALLKAYAAELHVTKPGGRRAQLLAKMGELCERQLGQNDQAINHYRQAVQADPEHHGATVALRRLLTKVGQFEEVAKLLEAEARQLEDARQAARVWYLLGDVCENRLNAVERALGAYKQAIAQDPALRPAIDGCIRLLEQSQDHAPLAAQLAVEQAEALEPMYATAAAFRAGEVHRDDLNKPAEAAAAFETMLERDPRHVGALLALERIYSHAGDSEALARTYERQTVAFDDPAARVAAYRGLLGVLETADTVDVAQVRQTQLSLLQVAPNDVQALLALEAVALTSRDVGLIAQIDAKLGVAGLDRGSTSAYQTRLAEAMEARGDRSALEVFRAALTHDGENMAAARGISRLAEATLDPELLAEAAEHEARCLGRIDEGARLLVLAASRLTESGDKPSAAQKLSRALHLDPDHARAADSLVALHARGLAPEFVCDTLSRAAGVAKSKERRAALWVQVAKLESRGRRDIGAATAAVQRALKERPNDVDAHLLLAHFHAGSKKWEECVTQLQALLKLNPGDEVRFDALLRLATIQHERLKATALAANNVSTALNLQPENREALELMLRVQLDREELGAAASTAEKLVKTAQSDPERARALYHSARLHRQKGDLPKASEAFAEALSLTGTDDAVAQEYREWLEARRAKADWQPYAEALQIYLRRSGLTSQQMMWARRALGVVLYDKLDKAVEGLGELQAALSLAPEDAELRRAVAERLERAGEYAPAAAEYHQLLHATPHAVNFWRALSACYTGMGRADQARAALAPLVASGEATDDERARYDAHSPESSKARGGAFGGEVRRAVEHELTVSGAAADLLDALGPALPKLYPLSLDSYAISAKDKAIGRASHPLRARAEDVAAVFGVSEFELYVHTAGPPGVSVECGDHPVLLVHADLGSQPEHVQVFSFARVFSNIARGISMIDKLDVNELELLLVCAARNHQPGFGSELGDPGVLDSQSRRINKAMPWFKGNRIEGAARVFSQSGISVRSWVKEAHIAALRAAALVSDDLAGGLRLVALAGADDAVIERVASFVASDRGQAVRKQIAG